LPVRLKLCFSEFASCICCNFNSLRHVSQHIVCNSLDLYNVTVINLKAPIISFGAISILVLAEAMLILVNTKNGGLCTSSTKEVCESQTTVKSDWLRIWNKYSENWVAILGADQKKYGLLGKNVQWVRPYFITLNFLEQPILFWRSQTFNSLV